jgi:hypothetical protein
MKLDVDKSGALHGTSLYLHACKLMCQLLHRHDHEQLVGEKQISQGRTIVRPQHEVSCLTG